MGRAQVRIAREGETVAVYLHDRLDNSRSGQLWREIAQGLDRAPARLLILDLGEVTAIDSAGVALLRRLGKYAANRRCACELRNVPDGRRLSPLRRCPLAGRRRIA